MKKIFVLTFLIFAFAVYSTAHGEYKITLKNGGKFIASDYKKEGSSIKLYTPNGEIEIDQSNIESIKETEGAEKIEETANKPQTITPKINLKEIAIKEIDPNVKKQGDENKTKELEDKHKALTEKEKQLKEETKKLNEDINKEGRLTSIRKKRELEQRSKELQKKADKYNKEIESSKQK